MPKLILKTLSKYTDVVKENPTIRMITLRTENRKPYKINNKKHRKNTSNTFNKIKKNAFFMHIFFIYSILNLLK